MTALLLALLLSGCPAPAVEGDEPNECIDRVDNDRDGLCIYGSGHSQHR